MPTKQSPSEPDSVYLGYDIQPRPEVDDYFYGGSDYEFYVAASESEQYEELRANAKSEIEIQNLKKEISERLNDRAEITKVRLIKVSYRIQYFRESAHDDAQMEAMPERKVIQELSIAEFMKLGESKELLSP